MTRFSIRDYRKFRSAGYTALHAISTARTLAQWERLERAGLVELTAEYDTDEYDPGDCLEGMSEESIRRFWDRINQLGVYGVVGRYRTSDGDKWETADSVWGCAGYQNVLDPVENSYVTDIMQATIDELKDALKARCKYCRRPMPATPSCVPGGPIRI